MVDSRAPRRCLTQAIGVIAYILLSGSLPFYDAKDSKLYSLIRKCRCGFAEREWLKVSPEAIDFVRRILVANPRLRPVALLVLVVHRVAPRPVVRPAARRSERSLSSLSGPAQA